MRFQTFKMRDAPGKTTKPCPIPDRDSAPFWKAAREHRLEVQKCASCGEFMFPPGPRCRNCQAERLVWTKLSGRGTVYTFGVMHMPLVPGFDPPYLVAVIELEEQSGSRVNANLVECSIEAAHIGMPVEVTFEYLNAEISLPQFRPRTGAIHRNRL